MPDPRYKVAADYPPIDHPWVLHKHAPIYEWAFPPEATDEELAAFAHARERWAEEAQFPVAWVVELSNLKQATAKQRRAFAEHLKRFEHHDVRWNAGSALVVPSAWLRGIVTAVFWISPPRFPYEVFAKRSDALQWAQLKLDAKLSEGRDRPHAQPPL